MDGVNGDPFGRLPDEMLSFALTKLESASSLLRLGFLFRRGHTPISTPHYVATTSRGTVPHISHDVLQKHTQISATFLALEDFIEKSARDAPIFKTPSSPDGKSVLRKYTALPDHCLSILGPRRVPAIPCPAHNSNSSIQVSTSVGFRYIEAEHYAEAGRTLKPDIELSLADVVTENASVKRIEKSADRTHAWLRDTIQARDGIESPSSALFASIPPLEKEQQAFYLADLVEDFESKLSGLALYRGPSLSTIPSPLERLPRLLIDDPLNPHSILTSISLGADLLTLPFISSSSEHGLAFTFEFPAPSRQSSDTTTSPRPLAIDLWSPSYSKSLLPLSPSCQCYTCTRHHSAYVAHLLSAREMLAWTLLQIHNFHQIDCFFANIRNSIAAGTFEADVETFNRYYEPEMPEMKGEGPRIRGYQMKSVGGGEPKKNPRVYGKLDEHVAKMDASNDGGDRVEKLAEAESGVATPDGGAEEMERQGFAAKA